MRALLAGARGEAIDAAPVIAAMGIDAGVERARPGVQGRSADHAVGKRDRRPHGHGRSGGDPCRARRAAQGDRRGAGRANWSRRMARPRRGTICRPPRRACGGCAGWRWGCSRRPTRRARAALAKAQYDAADNMTDRQARARRADRARRARAAGGVRRLPRALCRRRAGDRQMVRAAGGGAAAPRRSPWSRACARHPDFSLKNPNRLRALFGSFAGNQIAVPPAVGARAIACSPT